MVTPPHIVFRADASLQIGTGHVMRCLTLARALRETGAQCRFVTRALEGHLGDRIAKEGFEVTLLPAPDGPAPDGPPDHAAWAGVDWARDARETREALGKTAPDWLVLDHYAFDARWERDVIPDTTRLMVLDDLADRPHECDLLLDQNFGRIEGDYDGLVPETCARLIGPRYALLRPEFAALRSAALARRADRGLSCLLVTMGGVDPVDATSTILDALKVAPVPPDLHITVVMGAQAPALARVQALAETMPRPTDVVVDIPDMADRMAQADLAIGAGGATTWERCCLGLPTILVQIAENQRGIAQALAGAGVALDPGPLQAPDFASRLAERLTEAADPARLEALSEAAAALCDGDGVARLLHHLTPDTVRFRDATRADSRRIWEWRESGETRFLLGGAHPPFAAHDAWICRALENPARVFRILECGPLAGGYLRLDRTAPDRARVSICLSREMQGKGFGRCLLAEAESLGKALGLTTLDAEIHPDNLTSRKVFAAAGYLPGPDRDGFATCHRVLEKTP